MFELFAWFWLLLGIPLGGIAAYLISKLGAYLPDFIAKYLTGASIFAVILFAVLWFVVVAIIQLVVFPPMRILFTMDSRLENITKKYGEHTLDFSEQEGMSPEHKKGLAIGSGIVALILVITGVVCALVGGNGAPMTGSRDGQTYKTAKISELMTDSRDGQTYKIVKIGDQVWMAENLNVKTEEGSWCYENDPANCEKYGRLYTWEAAQKACPTGWHLPSKGEFKTLLATVRASDEDRSDNLRAGSWENGKDEYGFSALPAGRYNSRDKEFSRLGNYAYFWSSTEHFSNGAFYLSLSDRYASVYDDFKYVGYSVRCLQDN